MTLRGLVPLDFRTSYENESYRTARKPEKNLHGLLKNPQHPRYPLSAASPATRDNIPLLPEHNKPFQLNTHEISGVLRTFFHPNLCPQIRDRPGHRAGVPSGLSYRLATACYRCSTCFTWWILSTATRSIYQFYPDV